MISSFSLQLSHGFYAIFMFLFPLLATAPLCAIDYATVKRSEAQFQSRQSGTAAPPTPFVPSTSAPSTSAGGVTLEAIMVQFQRMDARLDTLTNELC